jgi:hypothetical protein
MHSFLIEKMKLIKHLKQIKMKKIILGLLLGGVVLTSCKKEEVAPEVPVTQTTVTKTQLDSKTTTSNKTVTLFADNANLYTGANNLYVKVTDATGAGVTNAAVTYMSMMQMTSMSHSSPSENPNYDSSLGMYKGLVVFTMASTAGTWTLDVDVDGETVTFDINVLESDTKMVGVYTGTDAASYIISIVRPVNWMVGMNDIEIMIHKKVTMMSFVPVNDFDVVMTPEMMSMSHGSPNNVSPTFVANGHYRGTVNFTMTGDWRLHFELSQSSTVIHADAFLDILF